MRSHNARQALRAVLHGETCIRPASVFDPLSARIAREVGFEVAMLAGSTASLAVLGDPDLTLITLTEFADLARRITRACDLPLIVDADHGYGNALNVMRSVEELENAGVAALTIEDTELPVPFGAKATRVITLAEAAKKIEAAVAARHDQSLVIVGRTAAAGVTGIADAISRCRAFEAAGADALFLTGITAKADLEKLCAVATRPVMLGAVPEAIDDAEWLATLGVKVALQGHLPIRAAARAIRETMQALRDGVRPSQIQGVASEQQMTELSRGDAFRNWSKAYLHE